MYILCHACVRVCSLSKHGRKGDQELELAALQACAATLCCGVVYDPSGLNDKGCIYTWLYRLLTTRDALVNQPTNYSSCRILSVVSTSRHLIRGRESGVKDDCETACPHRTSGQRHHWLFLGNDSRLILAVVPSHNSL